MRRTALFVLAALLCAAPAAAQQTRGFTLEEIEGLLRNEVASDRIIQLVYQRCIHFIPDRAALARVTAAGGSDALVAALRAPTLCSTLEVPRGPEPVPAPAGTQPAEPPAEPRRSGTRIRASAALSYLQGTFTPDGSTEKNEGQGGSLGLELTGPIVGVYLDAGYVDVSPDLGEDYSRGSWDVGLRLSPFPRRWLVRPYLDAGPTFLEISYYDEAGVETVRTIRGRGWSGAVGTRVAVARDFSLDLAYRRLAASFDEDTRGSDSPIRGEGSRWMAGLRWGR